MLCVMAESVERFPVPTSHAEDLKAAARYLVRRMEARPKGAKPDAFFYKLLSKHQQVMGALWYLEHSQDDVAYVTSDERALIARVCAWLHDNPDERTRKTA